MLYVAFALELLAWRMLCGQQTRGTDLTGFFFGYILSVMNLSQIRGLAFATEGANSFLRLRICVGIWVTK